MKTYRLVCNPYTVTNSLALKTDKGFKMINENSALAVIEHDRMHRWLAPHDSWKGFFAELGKASGTSELTIDFIGTKQDYDDLVSACRKYTPELNMKVTVHSELSMAQQSKIAGDYKLTEADTLLKKAKKNSALLSTELNAYFDKALDPYFEINVVAPTSCGKSTVQNALMGRKLLPTSTLAKTAVITRTTINNSMTDFTVKSVMHNGKVVEHKEQVTQKFIEQLNDEFDPSDAEHKKALRDYIYLEGPSKQFEDTALQLVFVDTPGPTTATNVNHKKVTQKALSSENKGMIIFVFSETSIQKEETQEVLKEAAEAMKAGLNGRMSEDRMLFVCTGGDLIDNLEDSQRAIREVLEMQGIVNPNLFIVSARVIEAMRMKEFNAEMKAAGRTEMIQPLTKAEELDFQNDVEKLSLPDCNLYRYSTVPSDKMSEYEERIDSLRKEKTGYEDQIAEIDSNDSLSRREKAAAKVDYEDAIDDINYQIAYINSGIPALEYTIREYLNRYAIPMKIQQLRENVSRKAEEQAMLRKATDKWLSSENSRKAAENEAARLLEKYESNATLQRDRNKLSNIRLDKVALTKKNAEVQKRLDGISTNAYSGEYKSIGERYGHWLSLDDAESYVADVNGQIGREVSKMCDDMNSYFNNSVVNNCHKIMDEYRAHVKALQEDGMFNLAGLDLSKMTGYANYCAPDIVLSEISTTQKEVIGYRTVKLTGLLNWINRLRGTGGIRKDPVYEDRTYVMAEDIKENQIAESRHEFDSWFNERVEEIKDNIETLKAQVSERMDNLDNYMKETFISYGKKLKDSDRLRKEAEQRKKESEWVAGFLDDVNKLTNVENVKES